MKIEKNILQTIAYFDMFHYPLSVEEIHRFINQPVTITEIREGLNHLADKNHVFNLEEFYSLQNDTSLVEKRKKGNARAGELLPIAYRIGRQLGKFPFVTGVGISGSLSKNYADEEADIDFFIITKPNRLWIARTLLHCLKKLSFLVGKHHWYCMNYFIDEEALIMAEKNIFIATEVVTLQPVFGNMAIAGFFSANTWAFDYFPNYVKQTPVIDPPTHTALFKKWLESIFNNRLGIWLDNYLMYFTEKRWLKKERKHKLNIKGEPLSLRVSKHFARPNPEHFQKKIMALFADKLKNMEAEWGVDDKDTGHFFRKEII